MSRLIDRRGTRNRSTRCESVHGKQRQKTGATRLGGRTNTGGRCEALEQGKRCSKAQPHNRMFTDHIKERQDGDALFDAANGQCLCGRHHTLKTAQRRANRLG
jgi:hypothetical protein